MQPQKRNILFLIGILDYACYIYFATLHEHYVVRLSKELYANENEKAGACQ